MNKIAQGMKQFLNDEEGVTAIEYGLIAALIAVGIIVAVEGLRDGLIATFGAIAAKLPAAG